MKTEKPTIEDITSTIVEASERLLCPLSSIRKVRNVLHAPTFFLAGGVNVFVGVLLLNFFSFKHSAATMKVVRIIV